MDRRVLVCNYRVPNSTVSKGSKAYVTFFAGDGQSVCVKARSRSGRWVKRWERIWKLENFRLKALPPEHPRYNDVDVFTH